MRCHTLVLEEGVDFSKPIFLSGVCCWQSLFQGPVRAFNFSICLQPVRCDFSVSDAFMQVFFEGVGDEPRAIVAGDLLWKTIASKYLLKVPN